jgi:hypothetical protein
MFMNITTSRIYKFLLFISLLLILDQVTGLILKTLYFHQRSGPNYSLNYTFEECNSDILIFGASRAQHNYDPRIIGDSLNMTCYNSGLDGGHSILFQYAQIEVVTKRYLPKIIILEFNPNEIVYYSDNYDKLSILLPYYLKYPELQPLVKLKSRFEKLKLLSATYPFNSNIINIIRFNTNTNAARKRDFEGFVPIINKVMDENMIRPRSNPESEIVIDTNLVLALKNIIDICKENRISLYIVSSPLYNDKDAKRPVTSAAARLSLQIINENKVNYLDYSYDTNFTGYKQLFSDFNHLNDKGATKFSQLIAGLIKQKEDNKSGVLLFKPYDLITENKN